MTTVHVVNKKTGSTTTTRTGSSRADQIAQTTLAAGSTAKAPKVVAPTEPAQKSAPETQLATQPASEALGSRKLTRTEYLALTPERRAEYQAARTAFRAKQGKQAGAGGGAPKTPKSRVAKSVLRAMKLLGKVSNVFQGEEGKGDAAEGAMKAAQATQQWASELANQIAKLPEDWKPAKGATLDTPKPAQIAVGSYVVIRTDKLDEKKLRGLEVLVGSREQTLTVTKEHDGKFIVQGTDGKAIVPKGWLALAGDANEGQAAQ